MQIVLKQWGPRALLGIAAVLLLAGVVEGFNLWVDKTFVVKPALALNARSPTIAQ